MALLGKTCSGVVVCMESHFALLLLWLRAHEQNDCLQNTYLRKLYNSVAILHGIAFCITPAVVLRTTTKERLHNFCPTGIYNRVMALHGIAFRITPAVVLCAPTKERLRNVCFAWIYNHVIPLHGIAFRFTFDFAFHLFSSAHNNKRKIA